MQNQISVFFIFILNGILIGVLFDLFRISRKSFKTPDLVTYIEDIIFGIITGILIIFTMVKFNQGEIRIYIFFGIILGNIFYLLVFSNIFIKISCIIIEYIKKMVYIIFIIPIKFVCRIIRKLFLKPIIFMCLNIKKILNSSISKKFLLKNKNIKKIVEK